MSMKALLGIGDLNLSDREIMFKFKNAYDQGLDHIEFLKSDGSKVVIRLPNAPQADFFDNPWFG